MSNEPLPEPIESLRGLKVDALAPGVLHMLALRTMEACTRGAGDLPHERVLSVWALLSLMRAWMCPRRGAYRSCVWRVGCKQGSGYVCMGRRAYCTLGCARLVPCSEECAAPVETVPTPHRIPFCGGSDGMRVRCMCMCMCDRAAAGVRERCRCGSLRLKSGLLCPHTRGHHGRNSGAECGGRAEPQPRPHLGWLRVLVERELVWAAGPRRQAQQAFADAGGGAR